MVDEQSVKVDNANGLFHWQFVEGLNFYTM